MLVLSTFCQTLVALCHRLGHAGREATHKGRAVAVSDCAALLLHLADFGLDDVLLRLVFEDSARTKGEKQGPV